MKNSLFLSTVVCSSLWAIPASAQLATIESITGGTAFIQYRGVSSLRIANDGETLGQGDALFPPTERVQVTVRCPNGRRELVLQGRLSGIGIICPDIRIVKYRADDTFLALNRGDFPYITQVTEANPTLQWPTLAGVEHYQVRVYREELGELTTLLWEAETADTSVLYQGSSLQPEERYVLLVAPNSESSLDLCADVRTLQAIEDAELWRTGECFRATLTRLSPAKTGELEENIALIQAATDDLDSQALVSAYRYSVDGLVWDAMASLEPLVGKSQKLAGTHLLLGEVYLKAGYMEQAKAALVEAQRLAEASEDFQTQMEAYIGLAKVAAWQMQPEQTHTYLSAALRDANYIEDVGWADLIVQWLDKI